MPALFPLQQSALIVEELLGDAILHSLMDELDFNPGSKFSTPGTHPIYLPATHPMAIEKTASHGLEERRLSSSIWGVDNVQSIGEWSKFHSLKEATEWKKPVFVKIAAVQYTTKPGSAPNAVAPRRSVLVLARIAAAPFSRG